MLDFVGPDELCLAFLDQLKTVVEKLPQGEETPGRRFVISRLVFMTHGIFRDEGRVGLVVLDTLDAHATLDLERAFKPQVISKTIQVTGEGITVASRVLAAEQQFIRRSLARFRLYPSYTGCISGLAVGEHLV